MVDRLRNRLVEVDDAAEAVRCKLQPACAMHNLYPLSEAMRRQLTDSQSASVACMVLPLQQESDHDALDSQVWARDDVRAPGAEVPSSISEALGDAQRSGRGAVSCEEWESMNLELTRAEYETECKHLFERGLSPVSRLLDRLDLSVSEIDEVVMVGGMTRTPRVRELLQKHLGARHLNVEIDPDVVVAYGAASMAY